MISYRTLDLGGLHPNVCDECGRFKVIYRAQMLDDTLPLGWTLECVWCGTEYFEVYGRPERDGWQHIP